MPHLRFVVAICATLLSIAVLAPAAHAADGLTSGALYEAGPDGRYLMGGDWLFRLDSADQGLAQRFMRTTSTAGWAPTKVPNAWNATDTSNESMAGSIGWYRKDFRVPRAPARTTWLVRFESVNYRARVFLNGREIGRHEGAYIAFELPASSIKRGAVSAEEAVKNQFGPLDPEVPYLMDAADGLPLVRGERRSRLVVQPADGRSPRTNGRPSAASIR